MSAENERASAKIYQFPVRGRFAKPGDAAYVESPLPTAAIGSAWYHDDAIKEDQPKPIRRH